MTETKSKGIFSLFTAVISYLYSAINELVVILIFFIIMDYVLGIIEIFWTKKQFDKETAIRGVIKKVLYSFVFITGLLADYIITYFTKTLGIELPVKSMFGIAALAYLLGTEGFSICKHFLILGVPAGDFLLKFFGLLKDSSGKIVPIPETEKSGDGDGTGQN